MKALLSLNVTRRDLNSFIACLLSFSLLMMPFVPVVAAASRGSERQIQKSSQAQPATSNVVAVNAPLPAPAPAPFVATITATKTGTIIGDDGDNKADPNASPNPAEKIEYNVTITNTGNTDATNVVFSDTIDAHTTLVPNSINTQPIADPDTYAASGNIPITLAAPGVLGNDRDPDTGNNSGLTVTKVQGNVANIGNATATTKAGRGGVTGFVTLNANGGFTYEPPPGYEGTGANADSFTYEISDGTKTDTATVTINITGMAWFICNNCGGSNLGTFSQPFTAISFFNTANAGTGAIPDPKNGDAISLRLGIGTYNETDGVNLRAQQKLIGNAIAFNTVFAAAANSSSAYTTFAAGTTARPNITTTGGNGVDLSTDNTVRGLNVGNTPGFFKFNGSSVGSPIINTVDLSGTGGALNVSTSGAFASNVTFGQFESTSSPTSNLNLVGVTGTLGITTAGAGLSGSTAGSAAVNISGGSVGFTYSGNVSKTNTGALVNVAGHSTGILTFQTGTLSATNGTGLQFSTANGTYNFNGTNTLNGGDAGIDILSNSTGTFSFSNLSTITSPTGTSLNVDTGSPSVTYSGSITHNTSGQRAVNINATTGGSVTINSVTAGSTAGGAGNTGVNINNANGSVTFTTLNLGGDPGVGGTRMTQQAVTIAGGTGAKSLGTVSIFTSGATAEGIHSGTTTGAITITTGTVNSAGAAAINIAGTSAASRTPLNIQLTSVAANGGARGLQLLNTSATGSPGGFRVNGSGTTDGSGGTIQNTTTRGADIQTADSIVLKNMNFTNANNSVDGGGAGACDDGTISGCNAAIYLSALTTLATFDNLNLTGTMVENGVTAIGVANFKFDNSVIDGAGDAVDETGINAQNLSGTATVNNTEIRFSETDAFRDTNTDTNVNLTISGSTFRDSQTVSSGGAVNTNGEGGFFFRNLSVAAGAPSSTINVTNSSFLRLRTQAIQVFAQDDTTVNLDITGSTLDSQTDIGTGIDINTDDTATMNFNILNNPTIQSRGGSAVNITSFLGSHMEGRVNNNPDIEVQGGAGIAVRLVAQETSSMIVEINGNTISTVNGSEDTALDVQSRFQTARADVTITNNNVTVKNNGVADINLISGSSTAGESNITCGDVANNVGHGLGSARAFRIRVSDVSNTNRLFLEGFVEAGTAAQDTEATWSGRGNTPTGASEVTASLTGTAVGPLAPPGGVCQAVDTPSDFTKVIAPSKANDQFASAPKPANQDVAIATASVQAPAASTQPSLFARAVTSLSNFAVGMLALIEPTAHASSEAPRSEPAAATVNSQPQPAQIAVQPAYSEVGNQKLTVKAKDSGRSKVLSNHAKHSPRAMAATPMFSDVDRTIGTLRAGDSVTITFQVTVNNPPNLSQLNPAQVSNFGTVNYNDGATPLNTNTNTVNTPVDLFDTSTNLVSDLNPSNFGDLVTFTATVSETPAQASVNPTGTVDFIDESNGNAVICNDVALSAGSAQCQTSTLSAGTHNIRAIYSGDGNFETSQNAAPVAQVVIACTPNPVVTKVADTNDGVCDADCSLREAVASVCSGTTITFNIPGPGPHTIGLTLGEIPVTRNVTIKNSGESVTVSGGGTSRVFNINSGKTVNIIGLTLSGGSALAGGAVINDGALTIVNSTLSGNAATGDGGAISSTATGTALTLINTTLSGNTAGLSGGGLITLGGTVSIINSTITNNTADFDNNASGNGGGIAAQAGTVTLKNTIVAGNFNEDGTTDAADDISGSVDAASSFNLIGTGGAGGLTNGVNNNQVGVAAGLGALADNGGLVFTHALLPTSLAVETGSNANLPVDTFDVDGDTVTAETLPVDGRGLGFPRNADSFDVDTIQVVDIGAFELHPSIENIADQSTNEDTVKNVPFNIGDDTGALIATVTATSSNTTLVPNLPANLVITGSGGSRNLQITPATNQNGTTTITVTVTATNGRTATDTFDLTVNAVNDAPVANNITPPPFAEDTQSVITLSYTDPESDLATACAISSPTNVTVTQPCACDGSGVCTVGVTGTPLNYNGPASFNYTVTAGGQESNSATATLSITAVNDNPTLTTNTGITVTEGSTNNTITNTMLRVDDVDNTATQIVFTIGTAPVNGTLKKSGGALAAGGTFTQDDINNNRITYDHDGSNTASDSFTFTVSDGAGGTIGLTTFNITITGANDAPTITAGGTLNYTENAAATAIDTSITVADNDSPNLSEATATINVNYVNGQDVLSFTNTATITGSFNAGTGTLTLMGSDSVLNYQAALRAVKYNNTSENPSTAPRTVSWSVKDDGNVSSNVATSTINVEAVNDAPVNTVPAGGQSTNQNTPLTFSNANGNLIAVSDVDAGTNVIQVTLTATNGTLTLNGGGAGLNFGCGGCFGDGTADATMRFQGTIATINPKLDGMTFTPTLGFSGAATLTIDTNDLGNTGTGGAKSDTDVVNIQVATNVSIQDASVVEPSSGSVNMIFTVTLSAPAPAGGASVTFHTEDEAPALNHATAGQDYTATTGTVTFLAGEQFKTIQVPVLSDNKKNEANETFLVKLDVATNATIADGTATGTILITNTPGTVLISELRTSGPAGAGDDFVEIYNNTLSTITVNGTGGGYGLFKMGATCSDTPVLIGVIPNGTVIPLRGHFLFTGSAYSLANYGGIGNAGPDASLLQDIGNDQNVALFSTTLLGSISSANRLDAVGFGANTGGTCDLFREGTTLTPLSGSTLEYSYFRDECGKKGNPSTFGNCPSGGMTKDSNVNGDDFIFADTTASSTPAGQRLGAPGPQNSGSPRMTFDVLALLLDASKSASGSPNRVRDTTAIGPNAAQGTLSIRRRFQNNTGAPVTRLRIRVVDISTTFVPGGVADLRLLSSSDITVNVNDSATCAAALLPTPCNVPVRGTTLETPPAQPMGGGFNSSATTIVITTGTPLANGASINLQLLLGVQGTGSFKFFFNVEALP